MRREPEPIDTVEDDLPVPEEREESDRDFLWEEGDPADRRKDPLRQP
jgi:hypothetical protein